MRIEYLADIPTVMPVLAQWHHEQFSHLAPGGSVEACLAGFRTHRGRRQIPTTVVALSGETLLGSASLVARDLPTRPELSPWLASVYVAPEHRRRGTGAALVQRVAQEAKALDVETLYLYTQDKEEFYARLGWSVVEQTDHVGYPVVVMALRLAGPQTVHGGPDLPVSSALGERSA